MDIVKTEVEGIIRDNESGALLNSDNGALNSYKKRKQKNAEINRMKEEMDELKNDVSEIKSLLTKIAEKL